MYQTAGSGMAHVNSVIAENLVRLSGILLLRYLYTSQSQKKRLKAEQSGWVNGREYCWEAETKCA